MYLLLDFGAVFPYLAANAATPLAAVYLGRIPDRARTTSRWCAGSASRVFLVAMLPLIFGGKIYNTLKALMSFKIVTVLGFLLFWPSSFPTPTPGAKSSTGFVKFGTVPVTRRRHQRQRRARSRARIGTSDGHLDVVEEPLPPTIDADGDGKPDAWADIDGDGKPDKFDDVDGDGFATATTPRTSSVALVQGRRFPTIDFSTIAILAAFAAIAGCGGLVEHADQQLHPRPGLGHGPSRGRDSQRDRRPRHRALARRHGV